MGVVAAANFNSPGQVVIAGEKAAVERAIEIAKDKGCKKAIPLPVSVPVHTPLMQGAADRLAAEFGGVTWRDLTVPLVNNAEASRCNAPTRSGLRWFAIAVIGSMGRVGAGDGAVGRHDIRGSGTRDGVDRAGEAHRPHGDHVERARSQVIRDHVRGLGCTEWRVRLRR